MKKDQGFIVITSVIILSVVLLLLAQSLSTSGYYQSSNTLDFEFKELSYYAAISCLDRAQFELNQDFDYAGGVTIDLGDYNCTIDPITISGSNTIVKSSATVENSTTKLKMILDIYYNITSIHEE